MKYLKKDIIDIIRSSLLKNYSAPIKSDISEIIDMSEKLNVAGIVCNFLKKTNVKNDYIDRVLYKQITRYEIHNIEIDSLNKLFDKHKINYTYIKGHTLNKYYDLPYLRYSEDIDIVVFKDDFERAKNLLINEMNYVQKEVLRKNEISLYKKDICVDLHYMYMKEDDIIENVLSNAKINNHELTNEYKYLEIVAHSYKHMYDGLFELKAILDLYYLRKNNLNFDLIESLLKKTGLEKYNECLINYLNSILSNNYDDTSKELEDYLFNMVLDNGVTNKVLIKNKKGYILNRVFLDYDTISDYYPILKKYPYLTPFYEVKRLFVILKNKRIKYGIQEVKSFNKLSREDLAKAESFKSKIGLK